MLLNTYQVAMTTEKSVKPVLDERQVQLAVSKNLKDWKLDQLHKLQ